jgi:Ca-activated chloride channel family protein
MKRTCHCQRVKRAWQSGKYTCRIATSLSLLAMTIVPVLAAENERILFILDFSNSMNETLNGVPKIELMLQTMREILPKIDPNTPVGLRVYGHRGGLTMYDSCHASNLIAPVMPSNSLNIQSSLMKVKPRGMTPITYSLKQAVRNDFLGFTGKKRIILLSDGGENCDESPCKYVMELVKTRKDIFIDVIAFSISNQDDLDQLQCTALVTRGKFYNAETAAQLARSMNKSVEKQVEARIVPNY